MGYLLHFCYKIAPGHYCARFYDPATAIFPQQAPLAEKYYNISPYAYCANNPVNFVNLGGRVIGFLSDVVTVGIGVRSLVQNIKSGDVWAAVFDDAGIVVDVIAAAVPVIPGGVGYIRTGAKVAKDVNTISDGAKVANAADNVADGAKAVNAVDNAADAAKVVSSTDNLSKTDKLRETATIGQEAHRQIEFELVNDISGTQTEVRMTLNYPFDLQEAKHGVVL